ncbi:MAG TPA: hypothetical protein VGT41_01495 [Candidatus Babeliales bacterium]|nr:hypothetical protein [Candidatus Babeliales bacterium]
MKSQFFILCLLALANTTCATQLCSTPACEKASWNRLETLKLEAVQAETEFTKRKNQHVHEQMVKVCLLCKYIEDLRKQADEAHKKVQNFIEQEKTASRSHHHTILHESGVSSR